MKRYPTFDEDCTFILNVYASGVFFSAGKWLMCPSTAAHMVPAVTARRAEQSGVKFLNT